MGKQLSYHDAFFKKFLSNSKIAQDFLQIHLPEKIKKNLNFNTLLMESGSFIEGDLRSQCSDMLYSLESTIGDAYIYCLLEHQSRPEKLMAFRLFRYSVAVMHRYLEKGNESLPVVIPLLFYHGNTSPYPYSTHWLDCFADLEMAKSVYMQAFPLIDVTVMSDEEILTHQRVALMELVQKHIRTRDMLELVKELAGLLEQWTYPQDLFRALLTYLAEAGNAAEGEKFILALAEQTPRYREDIMTIAEQLEAKGIQKGRMEGIQIGEQKGREESARSIARQLLANGVDRAIVKMSTGLSEVELDGLKQD
ncbi:MAG: Rpn family recombination-promoting nuclease/putative transposase [Sodalis sp. (in: enterobacteria)]|uniref:Rpn family recombination-promoting nuclease/putative transposase n=1 Tax=Sodalis sp. (in: enterobacteria) TaxID=1898979 RepID=UPI0039E589D1